MKGRLPDGCLRCAGTIEFLGKSLHCLQCGWELLADNITETEAQVA